MIIIYNIALLVVFLFQGYSLYIFFSLLNIEQKIKASPVVLFLCASITEFFCYRLIPSEIVNTASFTVLTFVVVLIAYKARPSFCVLCVLIISAIYTFIEFFYVPVIKILIENTSIETPGWELIVCTINKTVFFVICESVNHIFTDDDTKPKGIRIFIIPFLTLLCEVQLLSLDSSDNNSSYAFIIPVYSLCMIAINFISSDIYEKDIRSEGENRRTILSEQKNDLDYEHFKLLQMDYNNSRAVIHDMKHHINTISALVDQKDEAGLKKYLESLNHQNPELEAKSITGNKIVDIIIYQKSEICIRENIDFRFKSNNINFSFVGEADICCIISNLLDNAIESARRSEDRTIEVVFYPNKNKTMYFIEITNSCDTAPVIKNNILITDKIDKRYHGFGLYSVKRTLKKYSGYLSCKYDEITHIFKATATIKNQNL